MVSAVGSLVWRDVVGKRWVRCGVWQAVITCVVWLIWETLISTLLSRRFHGLGDSGRWSYVPSFWALIRFLCFQASGFVFLIAQAFVSVPEEANSVSLIDLVGKLIRLAWRAGVARSHGDHLIDDIAELRQKIRRLLEYSSFAVVCVLSGIVAFSSIMCGTRKPVGRLCPLDIAIRGAALGLLYAGWQFYHDKVTLRFPIIQRRLFFAFKMGVPKALETSLHVSLVLLPLGETFTKLIPGDGTTTTREVPEGEVTSFFWRQFIFAVTAFFVVFIWETCHHLVQVFVVFLKVALPCCAFMLSDFFFYRLGPVLTYGNSTGLIFAICLSLPSFVSIIEVENFPEYPTVIQTKRHVFAPPLGSSAAETDPTELLLMVLEDSEPGSLLQYLAHLDLCVVAESNVDTWRRAASFEETGDTYKRLIGVCLKKIDGLTLRLTQGLQVGESERSADLLKQQMRSSPGDNRPHAFQLGNVKSYFQDSQVCAWSARTVASLTASSRYEDRYGVAQLQGCNTAVVSSLLSCLLVIEVYLGRRSSVRGVTFVPNSIKWTVPSRGAFTEVGKRQGYPFGKRTVMHRKAYAMADVLRTSVYQIVSVFGDEMVQVGSGRGTTIAERDWLNCKKPLYGTYEMHLQKLGMILEYRIG